MICPNCKKDYRDVNEGNVPGHFYRGDDHFNREERRYGMQCTNCGYIAEVIARISGNPYRKKDYLKDENTLDMFDQDDIDFSDFQAIVGRWSEKVYGFIGSQKIVFAIKDKLMDLVLKPSDSNEWAELLLHLLHGAYVNSFDLLEETKKKFDELKHKQKTTIKEHVTRRSNT